jgi:LuxR family transcriptional regulator, maltose regulon positive regulatory protein
MAERLAPPRHPRERPRRLRQDERGGGGAAVRAARTVPVAWVGLDERDDDAPRFFRLIGAALRRATGHGAELERALAAPQPPPPRALLTPLLNALGEADAQVVVCLDDLHLITDPSGSSTSLAFLIEHAPPGVRVWIVTRADPPLPLHRWRARGQLLEMRADDLRLRGEETSGVLANEIGRPLGEATVAAVQRATEGWAAGVRLAALALQGAAEPDERALVARLEVGEGFALEYLAEEVLARLPAPSAAFLLDTAAFDAFTPELVDAACATATPPAHRRGAARGLFLQSARRRPARRPAAPGGATTACFARCSRAAAGPRRRARATLQRRAADWFAARGATRRP